MEQDRNYLFMRAEQEEAWAAQIPEGEARERHLRLANLYRRTAIEQGRQSLGDYELSASRLASQTPEGS